ncbi:ABC transporter substrate-binding protein [Sphingomonas sp. PB2P19]|uniref:ABC transporter substrate-binding protein n=1 Tax=Sphingomonas rhamnosi TaxID=3096156 RepID=UPI002FCA022D
MRGRCLIGVAALALLGAAPPPPRPPVMPKRVVSLNMCADQLLVALADPGQIAALTEWARDPELSSVAVRARAFPFTHRSAEEVMALRPDLVIGAPFRTSAVLAPLKARGVRMVALPWGDGVPGIEQAITTVADAVGHPDRGRRLIAKMRRDLAAVGPLPGRRRVAAYYQRSGYLTGSGTLTDDMLRRVGLVNLAAKLGRPALSTLSLEEMALARPAFLVMDTGVQTGSDRGTAALHHPVLDAAVPASRHLYIPQALTVCGTPDFPRAVAMLAAQVRAADRAR